MKTLIIICTLLVASFSSMAQEDVSRLLSMEKSEAINFANAINSEVREPWKQVEMEESRSSLMLYFVPATTSTADLNKIKDVGIRLSDVEYYVVDFKLFLEGEDKELEIKGTKKYQFANVKLPFLDGFKVWEALFFNGTTIERIRADEDIEVQMENQRAKVKFSSHSSPIWVIKMYK